MKIMLGTYAAAVRQALRRWAYCKVCQTRTDQHEVSDGVKEAWVCESCHCLLNHRGEPIGSD